MLNTKLPSMTMNSCPLKIVAIEQGNSEKRGLHQILYLEVSTEILVEGKKIASTSIVKAKSYAARKFKINEILEPMSVELKGYEISGQTFNEILVPGESK